jgi:hypothetical protein
LQEKDKTLDFYVEYDEKNLRKVKGVFHIVEAPKV